MCQIRLKSASPLKGLFVHLKFGFLLCFRVKNPICRIFFENSVRPSDRTTVRPHDRTTDRGPKNHPKKATFYLYLMVFTRCRVSSSSHSRVPVRSIYHIRGGCVVICGSSFVKFVVRVRSFFTELPAGSSVWGGRHVGAFRPLPPPCG